MKIIQILLTILLVTIPSIAFAQDATQITILTDKQSYAPGDTISISGTISSLGISNGAILQMYNPFNVLIQIGTINIASDGTFHTTVKAQGPSWRNDGTYVAKILYTSPPILATATQNIDFKATQIQAPTLPPQTPQTIPTDTQNNETNQPDNQIPLDEQIKQRIALANKLKQQLDQSVQIPFWVKDTARKWDDGTIDNAAFSKDIQYFISSGLVKTSGQINPTDSFSHVPSWIKQVTNWWAQGIIQDGEYANSIQFLINANIIRS